MYRDFASVYDLLTGDVDYKRRAEYMCDLFYKFDRKPTLLLDLACGTGGFSNEFAERGMSVIGVDISPEMLSRARENAAKRGNDILYLCQDAAELDLFGTVDGVVCCLDSLNHIIDYEKLCQVFEKVSLFLEKDRLFIFDVNTEYKHSQILGNNTFVIDEDDVYCVWSNEFEEETKITDITIDFFIPNEDGSYERSGEEFSERAYTFRELKNAASVAGLEILAVYAELTEESVGEETQRAVYVTRKV